MFALLHFLLPTIIGVFVLFVLNYVWKRRHFYLLASRIPGISIRIMASKVSKNLRGKSKDIKELINDCMNTMYVNGTPKKIWIGPNLFVFTINPDDTKIVMNSLDCIEKSQSVYGILKDLVHNSLVINPVHLWKVRRKKFCPIFSKFACDGYIGKFDEVTEIFLGKLEKKTVWSENELDVPCQNVALDSFIKIFTKTNVLNNDDYHSFITNIFSFLEITISRIVRFWLLNDFLFWFTSMYKKNKQISVNINKFNTKMIEAKLKERQICKNSEEKCFLDILLDMNEEGKIDMNGVHGELQSLAIGAFETTSTTIKNIITLLAMHPDVQQKLYEEVKDIFQNTDRPVCVEDMTKMVYLEMVIKETLRVFNNVTHLARDVSKDIQLTEYVIPKGANVAFSPYLMHHNPEYWPDPYKFDPERFSVENSVNRHPYTFIAFSGGLRNCIGYRYEMNLLKTLIPKLVFRYSLRTEAKMSDVTHSFSLVLKWNCNHPIVITPRNIQ